MYTYRDTQTIGNPPGAGLRPSVYVGAGLTIPSSPQFPPTQTNTLMQVLPPAQQHRSLEAGRQPASTFSGLPLPACFLSGAPFSSMPASCHLCLTFCMWGWSILELEEEILDHQRALCTSPVCRAIFHGILPSRSPSRPKPALLQSCSWPCSLSQDPTLCFLIPDCYISEQFFLVCK